MSMYHYDEDSAQESYRMKKNPPKYAAGQEDDLFNPPDENEKPLDSSQFDSYVSGDVGPLVNQQSHPQEMYHISVEDKIADGIFNITKASAVGIGNFMPDLFQTLRNTTPYGWFRTWEMLRRYGMGLTAVGVIVYIAHFFLGGFQKPLWIAYLGVVSLTTGTVMSIAWNDKAKEWIDREQKTGTTYDDLVSLNPDDDPEIIEGEFEYQQENPHEDLNSLFEPEEEEEESTEEYVDFSSMFGQDDFEEIEASSSKINVDDAISDLSSITPGMASRAYLYESFYKVLRSVNPNFSKMEEVHEDSQTFSRFNYLLVSSAAQQGYSEDDYELQKVYENSFMYKMVIQTNSTKFKGEKVGPSIEAQEKYDELGREVNPNLFVTVKTIGSMVHIDIIKSDSPMVTLRDLLIENKDWYTDPSVMVPVALGTDEFGQTIKMDLNKVNSMILAGKPGMGKTWLAELILAQICMFNSPKDVNVIIADVKGEQGDFVHFNPPHVVEKVESGEGMMSLLRRIQEEEIPRRKAILSQYGLTDIIDLKKEHPEIEMPYLYILIEEMLVLGNYIQSEGNDVKKEYKAILTELINLSRNLGIRFFGLSQRFTDETLPKSVKVNIGIRMVAGGEPSVIEEITETKPKDFKYNIASKQGKYAIAVPQYNGGRTSMMIGAVLTPSNEENWQLYKYMKALWERLEP